MFDRTKPVLGIDIGKVITGDTDHDVLFSPNYLDAKEIEGAIEGVLEFRKRFQDQVCLISKCKGVVQVKTRHWLAHKYFFEKTGVNPNHVFFCERREGKAPICDFLGVTHFIDDRLEVHGYLKNVQYKYLFRPNDREVSRHVQYLKGVTRVENWHELLNVVRP